MANEEDVEGSLSSDNSQFDAAMQASAAAAQKAFVTIKQSADDAGKSIYNLEIAVGNMSYKFKEAFGSQAEAAAAAQKALEGLGSPADSTGKKIENLGITAQLAGRKLSALIDEALAGRWRQFDGTLASVLGRMASANGALTAQLVVAAGLAATLGTLAYRWFQVQEAVNNARGEMLVTGQLTKDSEASIQSWIKTLKETFNVGTTDSTKVAESLGALGGSAAKYAADLSKIAASQQLLYGGDITKYVSDAVKGFNEGGEGALKWAEGLHVLTAEQKGHLEVLAKAGQDGQVMNAVIEAANKRFADQAVEIAKARKEYSQYMDLQLQSEGQLASLPIPTAATRAESQGPKPNDQLEEEVNLVNRVNTALNTRKTLETELAAAKTLANSTQDPTKQAEAAEAVTTIEQQLLKVHTQSEELAHAATLARLNNDLAASRDFADKRVEILKRIYAEDVNYEGAKSSAAYQAQTAVTAAEREAGDKRIEIQADVLRVQMAAHAYDFKAQTEIEDQILAMYKQHYGEQSTQYQQELRRRQELLKQDATQQEALDREKMNTQIELAGIAAKMSAQKMKEEAESSTFKVPSLSDLFGIKDSKPQVDAELKSLQDEFEKTMAAIKQSQVDAADPVQLQAALDKAQIAQARYALEVEKIHAQAAQKTSQEWDNVVRGQLAGVNRAIVGMLEGHRTLQQGLLSIFDSILSGFITKMCLEPIENWAVAQAKKLFITEGSEAAGKAVAVGSAVQQIQTDAAVAAAGAYASTAQIPVIGPELAPGAAAEAFAAVEAFTGAAVLDVGAYNVPNDMFAMIHKGESVVPETFADGMRANNFGSNDGGGGGGTGGGVPNLTLQIHAIDTQSGMQFVRDNLSFIARSLQAAMRNGNSNLQMMVRSNT